MRMGGMAKYLNSIFKKKKAGGYLHWKKKRRFYCFYEQMATNNE